MGLEVANVVGTVGVDYNPSGLQRFDRDWDAAERKAHKGIKGRVDTDVTQSSRALDDYGKKVRHVDDEHGRLVRGSGRVRTALGTMFIGGAGAAAAGIGFGLLAKQAGDAVGAFTESEAISKRTTNVLKTTGGAANVTATQIGNLATALSRKSGVDDEAIQSGENLLLTFTNVRNEVGKGNDVFTQATKVAVDMSAALGQDLKSSNIQLGKALNDPIKGVTALQRVGVSFTAQQKEQIKTLVESGNTLGAQKLILKELGKEFGGAAEASATAGGKLKVALGNVQEAVGGALAPVFNRAATAITNFANGMTDGTGAGGRFVTVAKQVGGVLSGAFSAAFKVARSVVDGVGRVIEENRNTLAKFGRAWAENARNIWNAVKSIGRAISDVFGGGSETGKDIRNIISVLLKFAATVEEIATAVVKRALPGIITAFRGLATMIRGVIRIISGIFSGDFGKIWDGLKDLFGGGVKAIAGILRAGTAPLREAVAAIGKAIGGAFRSVWGGIVSVAEGFINRIIDVINIIPGVDIKHIGKKGLVDQTLADAKAGKRTSNIPDQKLAMGGKVVAPIAIMGEEAPEHPEWVIPTNPAYRKRAVGLWMMAAKELGIPGFLDGGKLISGAGKLAKKAGGEVLDQAINVVPGVGPVRSALGLANEIIDKLPGNPGGYLRGTWDWTLDKAKDFIKDKAKGALSSAAGAVGGLFSGGGGGLVPQVVRALAWARSHGWKGQVNSGYRSPAAQMAAAVRFAAQLGKPLSAVYPNGPLASSHVKGQAVDVTDPGGFAAAMRGAPADSYIFNAIPWDPVHFSVTGHRRGGLLGMIGGLGGELLASGTLAFKKGGKHAPKPILTKKENRGITRSVARGERGIADFETDIQRMEREYDQMDRRFGLSDEVWLIENDDGSVSLDTDAQSARSGELGQLITKRSDIRQKIIDYRAAIQKLRSTLKDNITKLKRALGKAKGKARKKERGGYRAAISEYEGRRSELFTTYKDLGLDRKDADIDLQELTGEKGEVDGATGSAAPAKEPDAAKAPELSDFLTAAEATSIDTLTRETALDEIGAGTLEGDVTKDNADMVSILRGVLDRIKSSAPTEIVTALAQQIAGLTPKAEDGKTTGAPTVDDIATGVAQALASFNASRSDLFRTFGANFSTAGRMMAPSGGDLAAGTRFYGGGASGTDGGTRAGAGGIVQNLYFPQAPPDPLTFTQAALHELQAAT